MVVNDVLYMLKAEIKVGEELKATAGPGLGPNRNVVSDSRSRANASELVASLARNQSE